MADFKDNISIYLKFLQKEGWSDLICRRWERSSIRGIDSKVSEYVGGRMEAIGKGFVYLVDTIR